MKEMIEIFLEKKLNSSFGNMLLQIDTTLPKGEFITLYGKSGAGKTSTLRMLAGLLAPDAGRISVGKKTWLDTKNKINLAPQKRKVGFVFQDYALFPNMTVFENLDFALQKNQSKKILDELVELMEIEGLKSQKPTLLSGGQKQRVALARALVQQPDLLLLDEPLSALDVEMRGKLQKYLLQVHRAFDLTTILISHDVSEIIKLSDTVLVLENGKIVKRGKPTDIFFEATTDDGFQFEGEIVALENREAFVLLKVLVGDSILPVKVRSDGGDVFKIGDKVLVSAVNFSPTVRKIE